MRLNQHFVPTFVGVKPANFLQHVLIIFTHEETENVALVSNS